MTSAWDSTQAPPAPGQSPVSGSAWDSTSSLPQSAPIDPTDGNSFLKNLIIGTGKGFSDLASGINQKIDQYRAINGSRDGLMSAIQDQSDIDAHRKYDAPLMATTGGKTGNFIAQAVPAVAAGMVPGGQTLAGSIITGALLGGAQPTATGESMTNNAIFGGLGGGAGYGASKLIGTGIGAVKSLAEPLYDTGKSLIVGRALNEAAGSPMDAAAAQSALESATPIVPGSLPTVGQASGNPSLAALERTLSQSSPVAMNAMSQRIAEQNAARAAALGDLAGNDGMRDYFAADRKSTAQQLYNDAFKAGIDPDVAAKPEVQQTIQDLLNRPSIQQAQAQAKSLAAEDGLKLNGDSNLAGMHYTKQALDDQISAAIKAGNDNQARLLTATSDKLENLMNTLSPKYAEARQTYAAMSKPLNQMDVAQALAGKVNSLTGNLQPNAYAKAISDATAAKATGFPGATLENTMTPSQLETINAVKQDLLRAHFAQTAGKAGSDTAQKLGYSNMINAAGIPTWLQASAPGQVVGNVLSKGANMIYGDANKALGDKLSASLLSPDIAALYMKQAALNPAGQGIISNAMKKSAPLIGDVGAPYIGAAAENYLTQGGKNTSNP